MAAWASFGADLAGFADLADHVLKADTWVAVAAVVAAVVADGLGVDPVPDDLDVVAPLGFSGVGDDGEVKSLYVRPGLMRRGLAGQWLAQGLARAQARGLDRFAAWATPFSLPVFERAGFVLIERVRAKFAGAMFERFRLAR